jgi:3-hydroxybutyryl-CoA dehydrogenase
MSVIKQVAVVGAGTMGSQIALQVAYSGKYDVSLVDADATQLERAREQNQKLAARAVEKGRLTQDQMESALAQITTSTRNCLRCQGRRPRHRGRLREP